MGLEPFLKVRVSELSLITNCEHFYNNNNNNFIMLFYLYPYDRGMNWSRGDEPPLLFGGS